MSVADGNPTDSMLTNLKEGTQLMAIYTPYFYVIQDTKTGIYYAGSRYGKDANPEDFMKPNGYLTSSKTIRKLIEVNGIDSFAIRTIRIFNSKEETHDYESKFLKKVNARYNPRFYNKHNNDGGFSLSDPSIRKIVESDGLTSYQRGARKASETKLRTITNGKNLCQLAYEKALDKNPELHAIRAQNAKSTMLEVNPDTMLNKYQENGLKISGEKNPSKDPKNRQSISKGQKKFIAENEDKWKLDQLLRKTRLVDWRDENGMTFSECHSKWMSENNPTKNSKWYNDGTIQKRIREGEKVPAGFALGRLYKRREHI